jgi:hypothetical protein
MFTTFRPIVNDQCLRIIIVLALTGMFRCFISSQEIPIQLFKLKLNLLLFKNLQVQTLGKHHERDPQASSERYSTRLRFITDHEH